MSETAPTAKAGVSGGFWRRAFAVFLDWLIVAAAVTALAALAYPMTGSAIRMAKPPLKFSRCEPSRIPQGFDPAAPIPGVDPALQARIMGDPANFKPNQITECVDSFLGFETNRYRRIAQIWRDGGVTRSLHYTVPVDGSGTVISRFLYLDSLIGPVLLGMIAVFEILFGFSPGKGIVGLRVRRQADRGRASAGAILARNLLIYGPFAAMDLSNTLAASGVVALGAGGMVVGVGLLVIAVVWFIALIVGLARGRPDPFWDAWTGTRVVAR